MSRCPECRSKSDCEEWCGVDREELYEDREYAYFQLAQEKNKNKELKKAIELYCSRIVKLEREIEKSKSHSMDEDVDSCLIRVSYHENI